MLAQRLFYAIAGHGIPANELEDLIYDEFQRVADEAQPGDWISFPDGTTYDLSFKPGKRHER